jgi:dephospho-CoA kinase
MLVGLTGGIGSGKTAVARELARHGAVVVDLDELARAALAPGSPGEREVVAAFGTGVLDTEGAIDRARLAGLVFDDPSARARLEAIVHPIVRARAAELSAAAPPGSIVVHDVPLLVESGLAAAYDVVVVVEADVETRVRRLAGRGLSAADARARIAAQASDDARRRVADFLLPNDDSLSALNVAVAQLWAGLVDRAARGRVDRTSG